MLFIFSVEPSDLVSNDGPDILDLCRAMVFQIFPDADVNTALVFLFIEHSQLVISM